MKHPYSSMHMRHRMQWLFSSTTVIIIALGWKYPALGALVLGAMAGGVISAFIAGRWFCGNLCPRGGFLERIITKYSPAKPVPQWIHSTKIRIGVLIFLIAMLFGNGLRNPGDWRHWGFVFWMLCAVTTTAGMAMAVFWNARSWCAICPIGSIQNWIGGDKYHLAITPKDCLSCKQCEHACPMHLEIIQPKTGETLPQALFSPDCLRCGECEAACPAKTLHFESNRTPAP